LYRSHPDEKLPDNCALKGRGAALAVESTDVTDVPGEVNYLLNRADDG